MLDSPNKCIIMGETEAATKVVHQSVKAQFSFQQVNEDRVGFLAERLLFAQ
jgi:hypothetical protein